MAAIRIVPFLGMLPRTAERLLGDGAAVDAENVNLSSGEILPIKRPLLVHTPSVSGPWLSVYRAEHNDAQVWLAWSVDVDIVRAPLPPAVEPRYYWTGEGEMRYARFSDLPSGAFAVGTPRPKSAPSVVASGGSGVDATRVYVYTFYSSLNEESGDSPASALITGKVNGSWAISGMDAFPVNSGTGTAAHSGGVTTFTNTGNHWLRAGDEVVIAGQTVAVSATTSNIVFQVLGNFTGATSWARKAAWNTTGMKRRLYRSAGSFGSYQLVDDDVGTSYTDTKTDAQILGDELISQGWEPPPTNLRGLIALPNGALAGFFDNQLCFSEPYQPHAWPTEYRRATDHEIVGIQSYGTTVVSATAGTPYVATGVEPVSVTLETVDKVWPCLAKRSMVSIGDGVLYSTSHGLAYIGMGGANIWTESFFTRTEWEPLDPSSMIAAVSHGRVYVRWIGQNGDKGVMVFAPSEAGSGLTLLSAVPDELYSDPRNGKLYLVDTEGIHLFDAGVGGRINFSWKSKQYHLASPLNLGAAKVDFVGEMSQADYDAALVAYEAAVNANKAQITGISRQSIGTYYDEQGVLRTAQNDVPRFDHDPVTLALKGLLIEEQRTNLFTYSQDFTNAVWQLSTIFGIATTSLVPNAATAPDGTNTATKVVFTGVNDPYCFQNINTGIPVAARTFTVSFWLWTDAGQPTTNYEIFIHPDVVSGNTGQTFVTITNTPTRYSFTWTFPVTATGTNVYARFDGPQVVAANAYCYVWGAQLEEGSGPTSYIPTVASPVTRAADVPTYKGIGALNALPLNGGMLNGSSIQNIAVQEPPALTFTLYCDDAAVFSRALVADQSAFKLPQGFKTDNVAVGLTGAVRVKSVKLAESMQGLKLL